MKIALVIPGAEDSAVMKSLAMAVLAGLTPRDVELSLKDDILRRLDPESDLDFGVDLAAITVSTKTAMRAYELAAAYRRRGVKVVLGGIHPTAMPDEALEHCDAVVVGEAEGLWERVVQDARAGTLQRLYRHEQLPPYERGVAPRWDIFRSIRYVPAYTVQASRGCPFDCEFCSVTPFFGHKLRLRQVDDMAREIERLDRRWVLFSDDNIVSKPKFSRDLFRALEPLKVSWIGQGSLQGLKDPEMVKLMAASGCKGLFIGFESMNPDSLEGCGKRQNDPASYLDTVRLLHDNGISIWAAFVYGLDHDHLDVFERTVEFARRAGVFTAMFTIQTPYPGTRLYHRLKSEGRLLDDRWWLEDRREYPCYTPRHMTREQLWEGWQWSWKEFFSGASISSRLLRAFRTSGMSIATFLPVNLFQRRLVRDKILGGDKFFSRDR